MSIISGTSYKITKSIIIKAGPTPAWDLGCQNPGQVFQFCRKDIAIPFQRDTE
jgi:hypothetical protein